MEAYSRAAPAPATGHDPWSEVFRTYGIPEVTASWTARHQQALRVVDIREADELVGPLGALPGAEHVPMGRLQSAIAGWDKDAPVVLVCRSGARSGQAALALERLGFSKVASLAGGMIEWRRLGLPTD